MAYDPTALTVTGRAPSDDLYDPVPVELVIPGYDATATQTLKNVNGTMQWVTDSEPPVESSSS